MNREGRQFGTAATFEEPHYPVLYWAQKWGLSSKVVQRWFRDEPGVLKSKGVSGRRVALRIPPSVAQKVYAEKAGLN
ncbi:MAG: hypothetical protein HYX73_01190 [Acidobacteria bacterium]|nr:hypothetical protein [Acidobacteriota bacterium]